MVPFFVMMVKVLLKIHNAILLATLLHDVYQDVSLDLCTLVVPLHRANDL